MKLIFKKITMIDFKGFRNKTLEFNDDSTEFFGDNASGKTTVLDGINYVICGKDSEGKSKFDIKPLDENNKEIDGTTPFVELLLEKDGTLMTFKRDGDKYVIDGVPKKANEYKKIIESIVSEKMFMTLINPVFFGNKYKWNEQKDLILSNFEIEDTVILDKSYDSIKEDIELIGVDDAKAKYALSISNMDKNILKYEGKIEYIAPQLSGKNANLTQEELVNERDLLSENINELEKSLISISPLTEKLNKLLEKDREYRYSEKSKIDVLKNNKKSKEREKSELLRKHKLLKKDLNNTLDKCSLCGSILDSEMVKNAKEKLNTEMSDIVSNGKDIAINIDLLTNQITNLENELLISSDTNIEIESIKTEIENIKMSVDVDKIKSLKEELTIINNSISSYDVTVMLRKDLEQYKESMTKDMEEKEQSNIILLKIKDYHKEYSQLIADELNSRFENIKINTFKLQKDGQIKETFEITKGGVPYKSLNSAGKIEAGIELIELLSDLLEVNLPIIIDNKEGITKKFNIENQLITLSVKEGAILGV